MYGLTLLTIRLLGSALDAYARHEHLYSPPKEGEELHTNQRKFLPVVIGEIAPELRWHLERFAQPGDDGLVFIGPKGGRLRRSTFRRTWTKPAPPWGCPTCIFTICGTLESRWRRARAQASGS
jgi:hypothetical protein